MDRLRTTITFHDDTAAAIEQLCREQGQEMSEAVNELIRRGLLTVSKKTRFVQRTSTGHPRLDIANVVEAIEQAEDPAAAPFSSMAAP